MKIAIPRPISHSSPSQIRTVRRCIARWWAEKVAGIKPPPTIDTDLGNDAHKVLEVHLLGDSLLDMPGFVNHPRWVKARSVLEPALYLFPPGGSVKRQFVETPIKLASQTMPVIGFIDLVETGDKSLWCVTDLKTIGDLDYAVEEEELRRDPQCTIYTEALFRELPDLKTAEFRHVYAQKKAPGAKERRITVSRSEVQDRWGGIEETLKVQRQYSKCTDMKDVPGNRDACNDYRGCFFRDICPTRKAVALNIFQKAPDVHLSFTAQAGDSTMGLLDVFGSKEDLKAAIEKVVAAGMAREFAERLNHAALKAMAASVDDPVNPSDKTDEEPIPDTGDDGEGDGEETEETDTEEEAPVMAAPSLPPPEKMHWKAASTRYAELTDITFDEARARIKAGGWSTEDVVLEIKRLEGGKSAAPLAQPTPAAPDTIIEVLTPVGDVHLMYLNEAGNHVRIPSLNHKQDHVGSAPLAFFLDAIKSAVEAKIGMGIKFRQPGQKDNDPVPATKDPVPATKDPVPATKDPVPATKDPVPKTRDLLEGRKKKYDLPVDDTLVTFYTGDPKTVSYMHDGQLVVRQFIEGSSTVVITRAIKEFPKGGSPVDVGAQPVVQQAPAKEPFSKPPDDMPVRAGQESPAQAVTQEPARAVDPAPVPREKVECIVYLDCSPSWEHTRLDELIAPFQALVEYENAVHYYGAIPFGKGAGLVANELQKAILAGSFVWPKDLVVTTWMPGAWSCFEVLARHCKGVVRGKG